MLVKLSDLELSYPGVGVHSSVRSYREANERSAEVHLIRYEVNGPHVDFGVVSRTPLN